MQLRLLRFLQERTFYPVGQDQPIQVDVRVVTATNADLKEKVRRDQFREDLYFRLRVVDIILPPLRERKEDIPLLAQHFLTVFENKMNKGVTGLSDSVMELLLNHSWPGNIRELENTIERAVAVSVGDRITLSDLPANLLNHQIQHPLNKITSLREMEATHIADLLRREDHNYGKVADLLGISRTTLWRKMKEYKLAR